MVVKVCLNHLLEQVTMFILMHKNMHALVFICFALCTCINVVTYICMFHITHIYTICNIHEYNAALNQEFSLLLIT